MNLEQQQNDKTLLHYLFDQHYDIENFLYIYDENEEYKSHPEEFEELREECEMQPGDPFWFEDELRHVLRNWTPRKGIDLVQEIDILRKFIEDQASFPGK